MAPLTEDDIDVLYNQYLAANQTAPTQNYSEEDIDALYNKYVADNTGSSTGRMVAGGLQNLTNALTFGFGDEIVATANALYDRMPWADSKGSSFGESYDNWLALSRSTRDQFRQEHKPTAIIMDIGGGILTPGLGLVKGAKGLGPTIGAMAKEGAAFGGLTGIGEAEGGLLNRLEGGATGATIATALSPVAGTALYGLQKAVNPFTATGQQRVAKEILDQAIGPEGKAAIFASEGASEFGPKTLAEVAQTPNAANLQMQMQKEMGGESILNVLKGRQDERVKTLGALATDPFQNVGADVRGNIIRGSAEKIVNKADKLQQEAWSAVDKTETGINIKGARRKTLFAAKEFKNVLGFSGDANKVISSIDELGSDKGLINVRDWQSLRSAAGQVATSAAEKGHNNEAAVMLKMRDLLDDAADKAVRSGKLSDDNSAMLREAIGKTREFKNTYDSGLAGEMFSRGEGGFKMNESSIPQRIYTSPEASKQFMIAFGKDPDIVRQARAGLLDKMASQTPDSWGKFFDKYRPQFKTLFGDDFITVKKVIDDLSSEGSIAKLNQAATGRGSITGQALTTSSAIRNTLGGIGDQMPGGIGGILGGIAGGVSGGALGFLAGFGINALEKKGQEQIKRLVINALADTNFAKELMQKNSTGWLGNLYPALSRFVGAQSGRSSSQDESTQIEKRLTQQGQSVYRLGQLENFRSSSKGQQIPQPQQIPYSESVSSPNRKPPLRTAQDTSLKQNVSALINQQPPLIKAIISVESNGNPNAVSKAGARGLMQVMPANLKKLGLNGDDPNQNIQAGVTILQEEFERFQDPRLAIAAYNAGSPKVLAAIKRAGSRDWFSVAPYLPKETREYVPKVLAKYKQFATT